VQTIPLDETLDIRIGNALGMDWEGLPAMGEALSYILGNPAFIGSKVMDNEQREDTKKLFDNTPGSGTPN
jgi:hypothetical protein